MNVNIYMNLDHANILISYVIGSFSVFKYLIGVMTRVRRNENENQDNTSHPAQSLITCFLCGWFIAGKLIETCIFYVSLHNYNFRLCLGVSNLLASIASDIRRRCGLLP